MRHESIVLSAAHLNLLAAVAEEYAPDLKAEFTDLVGNYSFRLSRKELTNQDIVQAASFSLYTLFGHPDTRQNRILH